MLRKLKFYIFGLIPGLIIVFFILNAKGASCSGYLPSSRVIAETLTKDFEYAPLFEEEMNRLKIDEKYLKDSIIAKGKIDFGRSHAQKEPCPDYLLYSPKKNPIYEIRFMKCDNNIVLLTDFDVVDSKFNTSIQR
ncbi:MAG: hypothetical protein LBE36_03655 [Flavobacteriaceae bacterium]|jgi:hypothetical protein|nr:hypothetical protein [Flavobacteriaceae bacterium]